GKKRWTRYPLLRSTVVRQCLHSGYTHYFRPGRRRLRWLKRGDDLLTTALLVCHLPDPLVPDSLSFHLVQTSPVLSRSRAGINEANVCVVANAPTESRRHAVGHRKGLGVRQQVGVTRRHRMLADFSWSNLRHAGFRPM